jgi:hypothetical protein
LIPIDDTIPVRFERRLVELFLKPKGIDTGHIKTAREVVLSIFPTEQSIIASNVEVSTWMMNLNRRTNADAVGE